MWCIRNPPLSLFVGYNFHRGGFLIHHAEKTSVFVCSPKFFAIFSYGIMICSYTSMLFMNNRGKSVAGPGFPRGSPTPKVRVLNQLFSQFFSKTV